MIARERSYNSGRAIHPGMILHLCRQKSIMKITSLQIEGVDGKDAFLDLIIERAR